MKCGSCLATDAGSYKRIAADNELFEILKTLNPTRTYNSKHPYFCGSCIQQARFKLSHKVTTISVQNAEQSYTRISSLFGFSSSSDSSKDEYDRLVDSRRVLSDKGTPLVIPPTRNKRPAGSVAATKSKPCPERFKKPLAPIQLTNIPEEPTIENASFQQEISKDKSHPNSGEVNSEQDPSSQQNSSESIPESEMLFHFDDASSQTSSHSPASDEERSIATSLQPNSSPHTSKSLPSKGLPNQHEDIANATVSTNPESFVRQKDDSNRDASTSKKTGPQRPDPNPNEVIASGSISDTSSNQHRDKTSRPQRPDPNSPSQYDASDESIVQGSISGPSAPPVKNPRVREENRNMPRDLRNYFDTGNFQVGNYSRSLAG